MKNATMWLVGLLGLIALFVFSRKTSAARDGSGASSAVTGKALNLVGKNVNFDSLPAFTQGKVTANITELQKAEYAAGAITTAAAFLEYPPAYCVEAALSSLNKYCGSPGAPTPAGSNYVTPGSAFSTAAHDAVQKIDPNFNTKIDNCGPKIDYLAKVIKKTGRPNVWGINV